MKKIITTVCMSALLALTSPVISAEQNFDVPKYELKDTKPEKVYYLLTDDGLYRIYEEELMKYEEYIEVDVYRLDRNKDGQEDLIHSEWKLPEEKSEKAIFIDEDYDGLVERALFDSRDKDKQHKSDGIFDSERIYTPNIEGYTPLPVLSEEVSPDVKLPGYSLEGVKKEEKKYLFIFGQFIPIPDDKVVPNRDYYVDAEIYRVDRDNDGKTDLIHVIWHMPLDYGYNQNEEFVVIPPYDAVSVFVDEDYDGRIEKIYQDLEDMDANIGCDGKFDTETELALKIKELLR